MTLSFVLMVTFPMAARPVFSRVFRLLREIPSALAADLIDGLILQANSH